ncbi:MAG: hypothetical protein EXS52_01730 [Candidatus Staskawiczbacteria bacterium]|nr:hypothetical protein [Candidatus Staskawiczbacteria bacterium]
MYYVDESLLLLPITQSEVTMSHPIMPLVIAIFICPKAGGRMKRVQQVEAIAGQGLRGDRYRFGKGSWNSGKKGTRQLTLMNAEFFLGTPFTFADARRNIFTDGVELSRLWGEDFEIGEVEVRGIKYCYPCNRPSDISGKPNFAKIFRERGGLIVEIRKGGVICTGSQIILPKKLQTT